MSINLSASTEQQLLRKVASGGYDSAEHVIQAGLASLDQLESFGDFATGELENLVQQGEQSIRAHATIPAADVFNALR